MNNYVTTNIRIPEDDYLKLKEEAAKKRKSLSAVIREKIGSDRSLNKSPDEIMNRIIKHASENAQYLKGVDSTEAIREIRNQTKW